MYQERVLSGMRPTGRLHLGHYHGVLKNWVELQAEFPCLFFVCLLYTSDAADERSSGDLGGRRIIKKKTKTRRGVSEADRQDIKKDRHTHQNQ